MCMDVLTASVYVYINAVSMETQRRTVDALGLVLQVEQPYVAGWNLNLGPPEKQSPSRHPLPHTF